MTTFSKVLIANRGEIAVRVMRTAKQMGYRTVAVYSTADRDALHVQSADQAVCIGEPAAALSYLRADKVIAAAQSVGADAIHPGYGFLSENTDFSEACAQAGIIFIGPNAEAIKLMGSKRLSKIAMLENNVPCIPGYQGAEQDDQTLLAHAAQVGLPLMIKASAGGGGRGMRLVLDENDIPSQIEAARAEAKSAFGSDELILERALVQPRHIEIQIFADAHGNVVHLGERDCSIQRRHQKVVEESPSPFVDPDLRARMGEAAVNAARACDYLGAGTVEFLVDEDKNFYFLEMNTRLQVEHPVTELVTGLDLVEWQLRVAAGEPLPLSQEQIQFNGHAIEARLCAEDPRDDYLPQTGTIEHWSIPTGDGVRADSGVQSGQVVSPFYDSMLAKVISWAETREVARQKLISALQHSTVLGVNNNKQFLQTVLAANAFKQARVTTAFLQTEFASADEFQAPVPSARTLAIAALIFYRHTQSNYQNAWSMSAPLQTQLLISYGSGDHAIAVVYEAGQYQISLAEQSFSLMVISDQLDVLELQSEDQTLKVRKALLSTPLVANSLFIDDGSGHYSFIDNSYRPASSVLSGGDALVKAAMDGAIVDLKVQVGQTVMAGEVVAVLEAMKMAHQLKAGVSGSVAEVLVEVGQQVKSKQLVVRISASDLE